MTVAAVVGAGMTPAVAGGAREAATRDLDDSAVRKAARAVDWYAIERDWPSMTPDERAAERRSFARGGIPPNPAVPCWEPVAQRPDFPSEICLSSTLPGPPVALPLITQNRTVNRLDFTDLSSDGACAGGGSQFSGTGLGPELVYKIRVDLMCRVQVTVRMLTSVPSECEPDPEDDPPLPDPLEPWDVALYVLVEPVREPDAELQLTCADPASKCVRVSDGGGVGAAETITFTAETDLAYYVMVDGYLGSSGYYEIEFADVDSTGCKIARLPNVVP